MLLNVKAFSYNFTTSLKRHNDEQQETKIMDSMRIFSFLPINMLKNVLQKQAIL